MVDRTGRVALLLLLVVPALAWVLQGCGTMEDLQNELSQSGTPLIQQISPSTGIVGTAVAVRGANFGTTAGELAFQDPVSARFVVAQVSSWANDVIVASVPQMDAATGALKVGLKTSTGQVPALPGEFVLTRN